MRRSTERRPTPARSTMSERYEPTIAAVAGDSVDGTNIAAGYRLVVADDADIDAFEEIVAVAAAVAVVVAVAVSSVVAVVVVAF